MRANETHYRTNGDLVSALNTRSKHTKTLSNNNWFKDPLNSHNVKNLKNKKIFV